MNAKATTRRKPAARKAAARKPAARKSSSARPAARRAKASSKARPARARGREQIDKASEEILNTMRQAVRAQLGVYGEIYDELSERIDKLKSDTPSRWKTLVKRGEQVEKDLEKARKDLKKNLERSQSDLKKNLEKIQKDLRGKLAKIRTS